MFQSLIFAVLLAAAFAERRYDGYKVFRVTPQDELELDGTFLIQKSLDQFVDFWKAPSRVGNPVDLLVGPEHQGLVRETIGRQMLDVEVTVEDLQKDIDAEKAAVEPTFSYTDFNTLALIDAWMDDFAAENPSLVTVYNVGTSYEGRTIRAIRVGSSGLANKHAVWYEAGIHAREWISPATLIYMAKLFIDNYGVDPTVTNILDNIDVWMLPVYNVDGYEYTWTGDRMWRKTRTYNPNSPCYGADPNRNWDYAWGGESDFGCSDTFHGPYAHSEPSVKSVTDFIVGLGDNVKAFIDFHAYGQMWMTPWGYTEELPVDYPEQNALTLDAVAALTAVYGTQYRTGSIANTIYVATGSSADWAYGAANVFHSFAVELRGRSFVIDRSEIEPSGIETFEAVKVISERVITEE